MVDRSSLIPLYYQIYERLKNDILNGVYRYGQAIPSENRLVKELSVSKLTIIKAIKMLVDEGLLVRKVGIGTMVRALPGELSDKTRNKREVLYLYPNMLKLKNDLLNNPEIDTSTITYSLYSSLYYGAEHDFKIRPFGMPMSSRPGSTKILSILAGYTNILVHYPFGEIARLIEEIARMENRIIVSSFNVMDLPNTFSIVVDNETASRDIARWFLKKGHTRFAYIGLADTNYNSRARFEAFKAELGNNSLSIDNRHVYKEGMYCNVACGERGIKNILESCLIREYPTAIYCFNDYVAAGVLRVLLKRGIKVPHDVSLFGFNNSAVSEATLPRINSVSFDLLGIGRMALEIFDKILFRKKEVPRISLLKTKLVVKES